MSNLKFAVIGCGFWAQHQIAGWKELEGVQINAVCDTDEEKAQNVAHKFNVKHVYSDARELFKKENPDFVDIITSPSTHEEMVLLAAENKTHVICQKPMGENWESCIRMVKACEKAGVKFFVHENFRWQTTVRALKEEISSGIIGTVFKARLTFCNSFPVYDNQPFLAEEEKFIIKDLGIHILDIARFLFGEADSLYCLTQQVNPEIKGEDVANIMMKMQNGIHCFIEISYASVLENEKFPETFFLIEGTKGSIEVLSGGRIRTTTESDTTESVATPINYPWADPEYAVLLSSIVDTNRNILADLKGEGNAETTARDNLKTLNLMFSAYDSAENNRLINFNSKQ